jgi:type III restriction enzyme
VEFTATPARTEHPSNVLHHVSAAELKAAGMIKLPLRVITRHPSQGDQLLLESVEVRANLEKLAGAEAQKTGEYLRPILLLQAERVDACEPLRARLINEFSIPHDEIKISVGSLDELKNIADLASSKCCVRFIITVQKLTEGWDCPFAYVLCSLRETHSAKVIEQLVGRILRLPGARTKQHPDLNCAYAFSVSQSIGEVLSELRDALVNNGFTSAEAERIIIPVVQGTLPFGVRPKTVQVAPGEIDTTVVQVHMPMLAGKARIDTTTGDVTIIIPLDDVDTERVASCVTTPEAKAKIREAVALVRATDKAFDGNGMPREPSPYERNLDFVVPLLCVREGTTLFEFESTILLEHPWKLSTKDASLSDGYNPLKRPPGRAGLIDIGTAGEVQTTVLAETPRADYVALIRQQALDIGGAADWKLEGLVAWLDRHIQHGDIPIGESADFLRKAIRGLMAKFDISDVTMLALDRFRLSDEIEARIQGHREQERRAAFQALLLPGSPLVVTSKHVRRLILFEKQHVMNHFMGESWRPM